jgi:hypothetical protein
VKSGAGPPLGCGSSQDPYHHRKPKHKQPDEHRRHHGLRLGCAVEKREADRGSLLAPRPPGRNVTAPKSVAAAWMRMASWRTIASAPSASKRTYIATPSPIHGSPPSRMPPNTMRGRSSADVSENIVSTGLTHRRAVAPPTTGNSTARRTHRGRCSSAIPAICNPPIPRTINRPCGSENSPTQITKPPRTRP